MGCFKGWGTAVPVELVELCPVTHCCYALVSGCTCFVVLPSGTVKPENVAETNVEEGDVEKQCEGAVIRDVSRHIVC